MSKLARVKQMMADKGALSASASAYLLWYTESQARELYYRRKGYIAVGGLANQYAYVWGVIEAQRNGVDLGEITREEYDSIVGPVASKVP